MTAMQVMKQTEPVYKFKEGARIPRGVTVDGVLDEHDRLVEIHGHVTAKAAAETVLSGPEQFPNLRAFAPDSPEEALRMCVEAGIRDAFKSIVEVEVVKQQGKESREIEVRLLHAVPVDGIDGLCYEPIDIIRGDPEQKSFLIRKLRDDARAFSQKLENVLAELETVL